MLAKAHILKTLDFTIWSGDSKCNQKPLKWNPSLLSHILKKKQEFDLEVKVQGHSPLLMVHNLSSLGDLSKCQISKAHIERQKFTGQGWTERSL